MSTIGMKQPGCRSRDRFVAAVFALAVPSIALAAGASICLPVLKVHVDVNDPTPIIVDLKPVDGAVHGSTQQRSLPISSDQQWDGARERSSILRGIDHGLPDVYGVDRIPASQRPGRL